MKDEDLKYYSIRGLFRVTHSNLVVKPQYEESVILISAPNEGEAEKLAILYFKDQEDDTTTFENQIDLCPLTEEPGIGKEVFWTRRISNLTSKEYVEKYWDDGKPSNCEDLGWQHAWYNKDDKHSACYNCYEVKEGLIWKESK